MGGKFAGSHWAGKDKCFSGTRDVVADGAVLATKKVQITVPACKPKTVRYSIKFVCGTQQEECGCMPVRPGHYATHISIHNYLGETVEISKHFLPLVLAGAALGRAPKGARARAQDTDYLPPHPAPPTE